MKSKTSTIFMGITLILFLAICISFFINTLPENRSKYTPYALMERSGPKQMDNVCPPFHLRDEDGNIINPVTGENTDKPYSPKQTCGASDCHNYDKITQAYHFMQGAGEEPTQSQKERVQWASTPGNYGGTWCSPAPLYRYLSPKNNSSAATMDMTSYSFITAGCGKCHPGGGSAEYDRNGNRYDHVMRNPANQIVSGGENNFDGDYYQAKWDKSGVLEADCLLCHMPDYQIKNRNTQLANLNFKWAPTAGSNLGTVAGSVANNDETIQVAYNTELFNSDGTISPHIVTEPRNEACLNCHAKPGWKKRGANFRSRTDVHLRTGMKCVDCHPAGSAAVDERIRERENHQFGKGDDPGGQVRNDLDNTMRDCSSCHTDGYMGAPITKHSWLPPLHLDKISCQACHIPYRFVKAAQVQAGDVFNPGNKIPTKGKHLWTFYGPFMDYWNHYGDLEMMGYDDKPTQPYTPLLTTYKGKIYPVNRVHSAWPGIQTEGEQGLMQPKMSDIYKMWSTHLKDSTKYPDLALVKDDTNDGVPEVNRSEEIEVLIRSVTEMLQSNNYPMENKKVVWVMDNRIYSSGTEYTTIPIEIWEASAYANTHKYNHDVLPANVALGKNGCAECHSSTSDFFYKQVVKYAFNEEGQTVTQPQYTLLGLSSFWVANGVFRETYLKTFVYAFFFILICIGLIYAFQRMLLSVHRSKTITYITWLVGLVASLGLLIISFDSDTMEFMGLSRFMLDTNHFLFSLIILGIGIGCFLYELRYQKNVRDKTIKQLIKQPTLLLFGVSVILFGLAGLLMLVKAESIEFLTRLFYTLFDANLLLVLILSAYVLIKDTIYRAKLIENYE